MTGLLGSNVRGVEGHPDHFATELLQEGDAVRGGQEAGGAIKVPVHHGSGPDPKFTTIRPTFGCRVPSGWPLVIACAEPAATSEAARTPATSRIECRRAPVSCRFMLPPGFAESARVGPRGRQFRHRTGATSGVK